MRGIKYTCSTSPEPCNIMKNISNIQNRCANTAVVFIWSHLTYGTSCGRLWADFMMLFSSWFLCFYFLNFCGRWSRFGILEEAGSAHFSRRDNTYVQLTVFVCRASRTRDSSLCPPFSLFHFTFCPARSMTFILSVGWSTCPADIFIVTMSIVLA